MISEARRNSQSRSPSTPLKASRGLSPIGVKYGRPTTYRPTNPAKSAIRVAPPRIDVIGVAITCVARPLDYLSNSPARRRAIVPCQKRARFGIDATPPVASRSRRRSSTARASRLTIARRRPSKLVRTNRRREAFVACLPSTELRGSENRSAIPLSGSALGATTPISDRHTELV